MILGLLLRNNASFAAHQELKHGGFPGRQDLGPVIDGRLPISQIEFEVSDTDRASKLLTGPAQLSFQSGYQLFERERLHQIVIGATAQATDAIMEPAARSEHQYRHWILAVPELSQDRQAVAVG